MYLYNWLHKTDGYGTEREEDEHVKEHKARAMRAVYNGNEWRPHRNQLKYGLPRRNPWHPNMDNIMFYL